MDKIETYGYFGVFKLVIHLIRTKLFFKECRLIRFPIDIRNRKYIDFGKGLTTGINCRIEAYPVKSTSNTILFGKNVQINDYVHITSMSKVQIGNNVLIASKVYISDCTHGFYSGSGLHSSPDIPPSCREYSIKPVVIEDNVWIGESVSILPGVLIGKGSIIGAMSVVTNNIPPYCIAVGIPAKVIKMYNFKLNKWEKCK